MADVNLEDIASRYIADLPQRPTGGTHSRRASDGRVVLLTGSTGSLGSYILDLLVRDGNVGKVYCFNRAAQVPSRQRQCAGNKDRGLSSSFPSSVTFLEADLGEPNLALPAAVFSELQTSVTHIIHNAWPVNFVKPVDFFSPHLQGIRYLVDLCTKSSHHATLFFTSTVGVGMAWPLFHPTALPPRLLAFTLDPQQGYSRAKLIAEHILATASRVSGINTKICRIGQVTGPTTVQGEWNAREWFPSMLASSVYMGALPRNLGPVERVSWMPVNLLAEVVIELCFAPPTLQSVGETDANSDDGTISPPSNCEILHTANPNTTTYTALLPAIQEMLTADLELVSLKDWVKRLQQTAPHPTQNPAAKLTDMWSSLLTLDEMDRNLVSLQTEETAASSQKLKDMPAADPALMKLYMQQWGYGKAKESRL